MVFMWCMQIIPVLESLGTDADVINQYDKRNELGLARQTVKEEDAVAGLVHVGYPWACQLCIEVVVCSVV